MHNILLLGGVIFDRILTVDTYPVPGGDTFITSESTIPSGCALNTAITLRSYQQKPYIVSAVGTADDESISEYMSRFHLPHDCIRTVDTERTGYCITMVDQDGERTFFTSKGVESIFSSDMIPADIDFAAVYLTGYFLLDPSYASDILTYLKQCTAPIFFDPGVLIDAIDPVYLQQVLDLCYAVTPNEKEWELLGSFNLDKIPLVIQKRGKGKITVSQGDRVYVCYPFEVDTVDTTGAGDCFIGAFIAQYLEGKDLQNSLETASAAASYMTSLKGPHGMFDPENIENIRKHRRELR